MEDGFLANDKYKATWIFCQFYVQLLDFLLLFQDLEGTVFMTAQDADMSTKGKTKVPQSHHEMTLAHPKALLLIACLLPSLEGLYKR